MSQTTTVLRIGGMHCASCAANVQESLLDVPGVRQVTVVLEEGRATVEYDPDVVSMEAMEAAVKRAGFQLVPGSEGGR